MNYEKFFSLVTLTPRIREPNLFKPSFSISNLLSTGKYRDICPQQLSPGMEFFMDIFEPAALNMRIELGG